MDIGKKGWMAAFVILAITLMVNVSAVPAAKAGTITIQTSDPALTTSIPGYQLWTDTFVSLLGPLSVIPSLGTVTVNNGHPAGVYHGSTIWYDPITDDPAAFGPDSFAFWHELGHALLDLDGTTSWAAEMRAQAGAYTARALFTQENPAMPLMTSQYMFDIRNSEDRNAVGGEKHVIVDRDILAAMLERVSGGNYLTFDTAAISRLPGQLQTNEEWFQLLGELYGDSAADTARNLGIMYTNGADGQFLVAELVKFTIKDSAGNLVARAENPFLDEDDAYPWNWWVRERFQGVDKIRNSAPNGDAGSLFDINFVLSGFGGVSQAWPLPGDNPYRPNPDKLVPGAYRYWAVWKDPLKSSPIGINAYGYTMVGMRKLYPTLWKNMFFLACNGTDGTYNFTHFGGAQCSLKSSSNNAAEASWVNGALAGNWNGAKWIVVTDGTRDKLYYAPLRDPLLGFTPSLVALWTEGNDTLAAMSTDTDWKPGNIVPGYISVAWGNGLTANLMQAPAGVLPLPTVLDNTQVIVRANNSDFICPLYFVSPGQINFQVPLEVPLGGAEIRIVQNGVATNPVYVDVVREQPSLFYVNFTAGQPAAIFGDSSDPRYGQVVNPANPAMPGDIVTLFGSGLGPTDPPPATGNAPTTLSSTEDTLTVLVGGQPAQVLWSGLAPGFAGLNQINIVVPAGAAGADGFSPVILTMGGIASAQGGLAIGQ